MVRGSDAEAGSGRQAIKIMKKRSEALAVASLLATKNIAKSGGWMDGSITAVHGERPAIRFAARCKTRRAQADVLPRCTAAHRLQDAACVVGRHRFEVTRTAALDGLCAN